MHVVGIDIVILHLDFGVLLSVLMVDTCVKKMWHRCSSNISIAYLSCHTIHWFFLALRTVTQN